MSDTSPRPWNAIREIGPDEELYSVFIADANIKPVARIWPENAADAALIVEAVNERDRLRDIVRRLAMVAQNALDFAEALNGIIEATPERIKAQDDARALLSEARAALGEGEP